MSTLYHIGNPTAATTDVPVFRTTEKLSEEVAMRDFLPEIWIPCLDCQDIPYVTLTDQAKAAATALVILWSVLIILSLH